MLKRITRQTITKIYIKSISRANIYIYTKIFFFFYLFYSNSDVVDVIGFGIPNNIIIIINYYYYLNLLLSFYNNNRSILVIIIIIIPGHLQ